MKGDNVKKSSGAQVVNSNSPLENKKFDMNRLLLKISDNAKKYWQFYVFLLPAIIFIFIFNYLPIYGVQLAFRDYVVGQPVTSGEFVGLYHFERFFNSTWAWPVIRNTMFISVLTRIIEWPFPIALALLLHNCCNKHIKKMAQTGTYIPYLVSTVIVVSILRILLAKNTGIINSFMEVLGLERLDFFAYESTVFPMYLVSEIWQGVGYSAIIYLAALSTVNPSLHEAAIVDGASKWQRILKIDLPTIAPTIITMLILQCGSMFQLGADKILLMQTPLNNGASEVLSTYEYKTRIMNLQYSNTTANG